MSNGDGLIRSLVDGDLEGFRQRFESFLDQCPSFLYHVGEGRFLPVFFFSMFATAHDAGILGTDERVYFRFDNHGVNPRNGQNRNTGNLKVAILTNKFHGKQRIVRCYSISDRTNSDGLRFSTRGRDSLVQEIRRQNQDLSPADLSFEQYKVCAHGKGKSQGEAIATVFEAIREKGPEGRDRFARYSASEVNLIRQLLHDHGLKVKEIEGVHLTPNQNAQLNGLVNFVQVAPGQQRIDGFMEMLASNQRRSVERGIDEEILPYITRICRNYGQMLGNNIQNRNQKFESHGFLLGFLANFSHRYTIDIDLDLSPGSSYAAFLVHRQAERENVPIVINLAIFETLSVTALNRAIGHAERLHVSSFIPIHTESRHAVCVGLNFNLNQVPFSMDTVGLQQDRFPLVQRLFECVENEEVGENIRDFLFHHLPAEIPMNAENYNRIFDCITGFSFGGSILEEFRLVNAVQQRVRKYMFRHNDEDLREHVSTMVFHTQGSDIVILHIRAHDAQQQGDIDLQTLNVNGDNVHVWEVSCTLNDDSLELDIDLPNDLGLYHDYQNNNADNFLGGNLVQVPNAENVHNALNQVMNNGWQDGGQHQGLFRAISEVLMPNDNMIIDVNSKDKVRSMLHGIFYACDNTAKVITRYRVGQEQRFITIVGGEPAHQVRSSATELKLDLLLLRSIRVHPNDAHPIGYTLKFAGNQGEVQQEQNRAEREIKSLMGRQRGYLSITPGNEVVLSSAVFNAGAQRVEDLISIPQRLYIHGLDRSTRGLVGPNSVIDENPPENLLSDQTRENFRRFYTEKKPGQNSIFLLDIDDNLHVSFSYLQGTRAQAIETLKSKRNTTPIAQEILQQINAILGDGNHIQNVNDLLTLEFATDNQFYDYWLQQIDIARTGRLRYQLRTEGNHAFEVVNLATDNQQMANVLDQFMRNVAQRRLTLIITLNNTHWVTLVIERQNENYVGYYTNSSGARATDDIINIIQNTLRNNVRVESVSVHQQTDGHNCGLWALENATDINRVLNENPGEQVQNVVNIMRDFLERNRQNKDENYFQNLRIHLSQLFRDNSPDVQIRAYTNNRGRIDPLLRTYLELGYHRVGGGCGPVEAPISLSVSDSSNFGGLPQSSLEGPEASRVSDLSKGKGGR